MTDQLTQAHPLDPCDPDQCYQTMMAERTALITARRESEDNLIKTIIQLSSALVVLMAGFVTQSDVEFDGWELALFAATLAALGVAIIGGLTEQYFSSKAYEEQQRLVEDFFQKVISTFGPAPSNRFVRRSQLTAFISFVVALVSLGTFGLIEAGDNDVERRQGNTAAVPASTSATARSASATPTPNTVAATTRTKDRGLRSVSGTNDAAAATSQEVNGAQVRE